MLLLRGRPLTREHVWPQWVRRFTGTEGTIVNYRRSVVARDGQPVESGWRDVDYNLQVRAVCGDCNGGWMSDLERDAQPFLQSMIVGHGRELYERGQTLAATWACKTAMMFQARDDDDPIPLRQRRELLETQRPPQHAQVWLGAFTGRGIDMHKHVVTTFSQRGQVVAEGYGATFSVGALVCQVFAHEAGPDVERHLTGPMAAAFLPIWPVREIPVRWPPPMRLGFDDLNEAAEAFIT